MRLLAIALLVAACGGTSIAPVSTASPAAGSTLTPAPLDVTLVQKFGAAVRRFNENRSQTMTQFEDVDLETDWPAAQDLLSKLADDYRTYYVDLEAIPFPESVVVNGETMTLGRDFRSLIGWMKQLEVVMRQAAASASWETAQQNVIEFEGGSYTFVPFVEDATAESSARPRSAGARPRPRTPWGGALVDRGYLAYVTVSVPPPLPANMPHTNRWVVETVWAAQSCDWTCQSFFDIRLASEVNSAFASPGFLALYARIWRVGVSRIISMLATIGASCFGAGHQLRRSP